MWLEARAAAGSCALASSLMELKHTMGWDFFFSSFFNLAFKYYLLIRGILTAKRE